MSRFLLIIPLLMILCTDPVQARSQSALFEVWGSGNQNLKLLNKSYLLLLRYPRAYDSVTRLHLPRFHVSFLSKPDYGLEQGGHGPSWILHGTDIVCKGLIVLFLAFFAIYRFSVAPSPWKFFCRRLNCKFGAFLLN